MSDLVLAKTSTHLSVYGVPEPDCAEATEEIDREAVEKITKAEISLFNMVNFLNVKMDKLINRFEHLCLRNS
jgi:hypothetical protein